MYASGSSRGSDDASVPEVRLKHLQYWLWGCEQLVCRKDSSVDEREYEYENNTLPTEAK